MQDLTQNPSKLFYLEHNTPFPEEINWINDSGRKDLLCYIIYAADQRDKPTQSNSGMQSAESRDKSEKVIDSVRKNLVTAHSNFGYLDVM